MITDKIKAFHGKYEYGKDKILKHDLGTKNLFVQFYKDGVPFSIPDYVS